MEVLTKGTIEELLVNIRDRAGGLATLPAGTSFEVRNKLGAVVQASSPAVVDGLTARCLIDTNPLAVGVYNLYVTFNANPEIPLLGPVEFAVNA